MSSIQRHAVKGRTVRRVSTGHEVYIQKPSGEMTVVRASRDIVIVLKNNRKYVFAAPFEIQLYRPNIIEIRSQNHQKKVFNRADVKEIRLRKSIVGKIVLITVGTALGLGMAFVAFALGVAPLIL